jgi:putative DNA primase/helicase
MISLVAGRPDRGKSLFAMHVAAEVSKEANVLYATSENPHAEVVRPRLEVAGATLERVRMWTPTSLPEHLPELGAEIRKHRVGLVVLDPIADFLSVSIYNDQDVRLALRPLAELACATGCSIILVTHLIKSYRSGSDALDAVGGSNGGLVGAARSVYMFGVDPSDEDQRILAPAKMNLGPRPKSLAFELDVEEDYPTGGMALLRYVGESDVTADALVTSMNGSKKPPAKRSAASAFLIGYLRLGPRPTKDLKEDATQYGHSWATIRRAADELGIVKPKGGQGSTWALPKELLDELSEAEDD